MNQRTFLGLTHNPFTPPREGFFAGGDRKTHLDHLRHLSLWSRRVLVVTGPFGIGKSSLFRELSGSLEATTKAARLSGTVVTSERESLVGLLQGFGIAADVDTHADDLAELIVHHANEQDALGRVCMVMVDDAHLLEAQAVLRLVGLVATSSLRMLFFAEASLIPNLNRAAKNHDLEWFEIRLTGFPKADIRDYLEWRFRQAHYRGSLPFTEEQLEKIVTRSSGNPSVIDSMANRLLADMESGEIRNQGKGFPVMHATLALFLVIMIGLVYLFVQDEATLDEIPRTDVGDAELALTEPDLPATPAVVAEDFLATDTEETVAETADTEVADTRAGYAESKDSLEITADDAELEISDAAAGPAVADVVTELTMASAELVEIPVEAVDVPVEVEVEVEAAPADEKVEPPTKPATGSEDFAFNSAQWLLSQDPDRYTLQLLILSSRERAVQFIDRQANPTEFALYRRRRDDKFLYVITYGVFSGRAAATDAIQSFDDELAQLKPWIRPLGLVQDTIRGTTQE